MLEQLDLNLLLYLDTVLTEGSVARAADRLHVTPSAVSNALARLRTSLRDPLVVRNGRGIVPTPVAEALAKDLRRILNELEKVIQKETFDPLTFSKRFTLAVADPGQIARVPLLASLLSSKMPQCSLRVVGIDTFVLSGGLENLEIDVALVTHVGKAAAVHVKPLYQETSALVVREKHPLSGLALDKEQLAQLRHVEVEVAPGTGFRELANTYARAGISREISVVVPSFTVAAALVSQTDLATTLPTTLFDFFGESMGLTTVESPVPVITTNIMMVWHERYSEDPAHRIFREIVTTAFPDHASKLKRNPS